MPCILPAILLNLRRPLLQSKHTSRHGGGSCATRHCQGTPREGTRPTNIEPRDMAVCRPADPSGRADRHGPRWPNPEPQTPKPSLQLATNLRPKTARHACKNETCQLPVLFRFPVRDGSSGSDRPGSGHPTMRAIARHSFSKPGKFQRLGKSRHCCGLTGWTRQTIPSRKTHSPLGFSRSASPRRSSRNRVNCSVNSWTARPR